MAFGDYIRHNRNKLATHGALDESSLPFDPNEVRSNAYLLERFDMLSRRLLVQIRELERDLVDRMRQADTGECASD